ncbi:hypothetical protein BHM03_00003542 [Ensete ventricosum]|nr:hypothetical protein BHM03_00003542 [Ensete ventricosum]
MSFNFTQEQCLNGFIPSGPPLFSQNHGCAAGIVLKGSKIAASLAELVSGIGMQRDGTGQSSCLTTFGQVSYQIFEQVKVNLSGVWQKPASGFIKLGTLTIPLSNLKQQTGSSVRAKASHATSVTETADGVLANSATGSIAIMLDSEVDGGNKLGFWLEVQKSSLGSLKWGVSLSDTPSGELGWESDPIRSDGVGCSGGRGEEESDAEELGRGGVRGGGGGGHGVADHPPHDRGRLRRERYPPSQRHLQDPREGHRVLQQARRCLLKSGEDGATGSVADEDLKAWDAEFVKVDQATLFDLILV